MDGLIILIIIVCILVFWRAEQAINAFHKVQAAETTVMFQINEGKKEISEYAKTKERGIEGRIMTSVRVDIDHLNEDMIKRQDGQREATEKELTALESTLKVDIQDNNNLITSHDQYIKKLETFNQNVTPFINALQDRISTLEATQGPRETDIDTEEAPVPISCPICDDKEFKNIRGLIGHCARLNDPEHMALIDELKQEG